jgi:hypothetical protein
MHRYSIADPRVRLERYQPERLDLKDVLRKALEAAGARQSLFGSDSSYFRADGTRRFFRSRCRRCASATFWTAGF